MQGISTSAPGSFEQKLLKRGFKHALLTETHTFFLSRSVNQNIEAGSEKIFSYYLREKVF